MKARAMLVAAALLCASNVSAQDGDGCDVPIRYASHNLSVSTIQRAADDMRYENECKGNTKGNSSNVGIGYAGVDLKFGSSSTSTENFCKTYKEDASSRDATYQYARTVVRESLDAFVACKELSNQQVRARFKIMPRMLVVDLARLSNSAVFKGIGVSPSDALTCTRNNPAGGTPLKVDRSTTVTLVDGETTVVTCERTDRDPSEAILFDETSVAIDTNRGSATVKLEASRYPPPTTTEQLLSEISAVGERLGSQDVLIQKQVDLLTAFAKQWADLEGSKRPVSNRTGDDRGRTLSISCGDGEFMRSVATAGKNWSQMGYFNESISANCFKLPKWIEPSPSQ